MPDAGHYGTFAGKDFRSVVLPGFDKFYKNLETQIKEPVPENLQIIYRSDRETTSSLEEFHILESWSHTDICE